MGKRGRRVKGEEDDLREGEREGKGFGEILAKEEERRRGRGGWL